MATEQTGKTEDDPRAFLRGLAKLVGFLMLVLVGTVFACTAITSGGGGGGGVSDTEVRNQCHEWARDHLRSPSTAEFKSEEVRRTDPNHWTVTGAIDAENAFGGTVRATYTCDIRLDGDTWRGSARVNG